MASNLGCIGLAVDDREAFAALVDSALSSSEPIGRLGNFTVSCWEDPSGARLVITTEGREVVDLLPSFGGVPGAILSELRPVNAETAIANVVDAEGETLTKLSTALEQRHLLSDHAVAGRASIVSLGIDVTVHDNESTFSASDASLLIADRELGDSRQPLRMAAESFMSYGVFGPPENSEPYARLSGTVLQADRRVASVTGQSFVTARVRTVGFETDLCLPATDQIPRPGNIISGTVFLTTSMPDLARDFVLPRHSWLPWRRRR